MTETIKMHPVLRGAKVLESVEWWANRGWYCAWVAPEYRDNVKLDTEGEDE